MRLKSTRATANENQRVLQSHLYQDLLNEARIRSWSKLWFYLIIYQICISCVAHFPVQHRSWHSGEDKIMTLMLTQCVYDRSNYINVCH